MDDRFDFLIVGGGIAGLSLAARLAAHGATALIEAEAAIGYHSSGRSATFFHLGIGNDPVRAMTMASGAFFDHPPAGFSAVPLWEPRAALFIATDAERPALDALEVQMTRFSDRIERVGPAEMQARVPVLRVGGAHATAGLVDHGGHKLDSDALLQGFAAALRRAGGTLVTGQPAGAIRRCGERWQVAIGDRTLSAPVLVNAAGAWADEIAVRAGVRPLGLQPLRRSIIAFDPPAGLDTRGWPFLKTAIEDGFYLLPDAGRLLASPMDEEPSAPCDAQTDDLAVATAAWRVEQATTLTVGRIGHRWGGLRSFVADRVPTAGFAPDAPGFFWLAGQGGYGLQTAPAMAAAAEALILGQPWPEELAARGLRPEQIGPERLSR